MNGAESVSNKEMESEDSWILISYSNDSESDNPPHDPSPLTLHSHLTSILPLHGHLT